MTNREEFLSLYSLINPNQAEYGLLLSIYDACPDKVFLLEFSNLCDIQQFYQCIVKEINNHYRSHELRIFSINGAGSLNFEVLEHNSGLSKKDEELYNYAIKISEEHTTFILVRASSSYVLFHKGRFDEEFKHIYADRKKLIEAEERKYNIDQLEQVFDNYHTNRKRNGCTYVLNGKVSNDLKEQTLREDLHDYLYKETNMRIIRELCTSKIQDEESVDLSLIDKNGLVSIIEVKFFIQQGFFENPQKKAYSYSRFKNGYKQLNKYCIHLNQDNCVLHSAYLYMFYAHTDTAEQVRDKAMGYLDVFREKDECSSLFKNHYKNTICDDIIDSVF